MTTLSTPSASRQLLRSMGRVLGPFVGLLVVIALFYVLDASEERNYLSTNNVKTIAVQSAITATCGIGMTLVIIGGGIDLSIGSTVALVSVVIALVTNGGFFSAVNETIFLGATWMGWSVALGLTALWVGWSTWKGHGLSGALLIAAAWLSALFLFHGKGAAQGVLAGVLMGTACGLANGLLITSSGVVPFIITLGTMEIIRGSAQLLAKGESVGVDPRLMSDQHAWLADLMNIDPEPSWLIVGPGVWLMVVAGALTVLVLRRTTIGRYIHAVGSNEAAARLSGVAVPAVKLAMYAFAGLMAGIAGVMQFSRLSYGSSTGSIGLELDVIAAVVIGGGSLRGGEGSIMGTFIGAAVMGFMKSGCDLAGIPNAVQKILIGSIIILAVALDEARHRRRA